jgi:hypothetical protein
MYPILVLLFLFGAALADHGGHHPHPSHDRAAAFPAAAVPQIKYGGPIVYSGEKPPIIHFPPPPAQVRIDR